MIEHYTFIDDTLQAQLRLFTQHTNSYDNCNQPFMLDNDDEIFPDISKFFVMKNNADILCFASAYFIDEHTVYLYGATCPEARNQGYMRQLLADIHSTFLPLNITNYIIPISKDNRAGVGYAEHLKGTLLETECNMVYDLNQFTDTPNFEDVTLKTATDNGITIYSLCATDNSEELGQLYCLTENSSAAIFDVEIFSDRRGYGYGSNLLSLVMNDLKNKKIKTITLHVTKENIPAYNLYIKHGFEEIETVLYYEI